MTGVRVIARQQAVEAAVLESVVRNEAAALGLSTEIEWVDDDEAVLAAARAAPERDLVLVTVPETDDLAELAAGDGPGVVRVDLGTRRPDRSPGLLAHVQGRGVDGMRWALRAIVHRNAWAFATVPYGPHPDEYGHLRLPSTAGGPVPVAVLLHGGFWRSKWELDLMDALAVDLARRGIAAWNVEYRRPDRHGWDATVADVATAFAHVAELAGHHPLDLDRVVVIGHSAGAQLGARLAADCAVGGTVHPALVVHLAGVLDLIETHRRDLGDGAVHAAVGADPAHARAVYAASSPLLRLPLGTAQLVVTARDDSPDLNEMSRRYVDAARATGDQVTELTGAGDHFTLIDPAGQVWNDTMTDVVSALEDGVATSNVRAVIESLYRALGDRPAFDRHLDPRITIWESDADRMLRGTGDLDRLRDERALREAGAAPPTSVAPEQIVCDVWDDVATARYVLRATYPDTTPDTCFRVTDVLRRSPSGWRIVHHHSEAMT